MTFVRVSNDSPQTKAERQGFEPWVPEGTLVFETSAFNRSATSPKR